MYWKTILINQLQKEKYPLSFPYNLGREYGLHGSYVVRQKNIEILDSDDLLLFAIFLLPIEEAIKVIIPYILFGVKNRYSFEELKCALLSIPIILKELYLLLIGLIEYYFLHIFRMRILMIQFINYVPHYIRNTLIIL